MVDEHDALADARARLDEGDLEGAIEGAEPLTAGSDRSRAAEAWLVIADARYRLDDEAGALEAWRAAAAIDGPAAWLGWRNVAAQLVRDGDLDGALEAYREADRRAPPGERGAIANRIAWLLKETGHDFAARREFNRARGAYAAQTPFVTYAIIAICVGLFGVESVLSGGANLAGGGMLGGSIGPLGETNVINTFAVAAGEWWRIFTSAFFHIGPIHLAFNMYVLFLYGSVAERMYGPLEYGLIYVMAAAGGSVLTMLVDPGQSAAGASGAIFGIVGLLFAASRRHHAVLGREARNVVAGIGSYLVFLLVFTFVIPNISWTGHLGGLVVGAVLGLILAPTGVATLGSLWRSPTGDALRPAMPAAVRALVFVAAAAALGAGSWWAIAPYVG